MTAGSILEKKDHFGSIKIIRVIKRVTPLMRISS